MKKNKKKQVGHLFFTAGELELRNTLRLVFYFKECYPANGNGRLCSGGQRVAAESAPLARRQTN